MVDFILQISHDSEKKLKSIYYSLTATVLTVNISMLSRGGNNLFLKKTGRLCLLPQFTLHYILHIETGSSYCVIQSAVYGIKWAHCLQGCTDPTDNPFVRNLLESSKRQPRKPKTKKDHVTTETFIELCSKYANSND